VLAIECRCSRVALSTLIEESLPRVAQNKTTVKGIGRSYQSGLFLFDWFDVLADLGNEEPARVVCWSEADCATQLSRLTEQHKTPSETM
jgi:hypothetical protein